MPDALHGHLQLHRMEWPAMATRDRSQQVVRMPGALPFGQQLIEWLMTKSIFAALVGLALGWQGSASAQVLQQPEARRASQWETYRSASGQEVMTCLYSFLLPPKGATGNPLDSMPVDHHRALCRLGDGSRFAWFFRFDLGSSGTTEKLWVDVESGHWISVRTEISIEPRRPHENWESWKARIFDADPKLTTVHVETDGLRMPAFRETQREDMRRVVWQQLESQQPG